jgi:serpin B
VNTTVAGEAVNALGLDLLKRLAGESINVVLSPYSIQSALAMAYAGADGMTKAEMAWGLHYPDDESVLHGSFQQLQEDLRVVEEHSVQQAKQIKAYRGKVMPLRLCVANRLFVQRSYALRQDFVERLKEFYSASPETVDFQTQPDAARLQINEWVSQQTEAKIKDLLAERTISPGTRAVLVNAMYFRAAWADAFFPERFTTFREFHAKGQDLIQVPTLLTERYLRFRKGEGFSVVALPYSDTDLQLVIFVPDDIDGALALLSRLSQSELAACASMESHQVRLTLPKFTLASASISLKDALMAQGLKTAFDEPAGSANFDRMAARQPDEYLYLSDAIHKTFISVDEKGTEAAAATALIMVMGGVVDPSNSIEVKVDRPFLFAIQHRPSRACLFLGMVVDPR